MKLSFRNHITGNDYESVYELLEKSRFFYEFEINICLEMMEETIEYDNEKSDYHWLLAENDGNLIGLSCFGKDKMTINSWELFWLAIEKNHKDKGIGSLMLKEIEKISMSSKAEHLWVETSGRKKYEPTNNFYLNKEYDKVATLEDFYAKGDPKIIYHKKL